MRTKNYEIKIYFEKEYDMYVIIAYKDNKELVASQGKTFVEAFKMIGEAIELMEENE